MRVRFIFLLPKMQSRAPQRVGLIDDRGTASLPKEFETSKHTTGPCMEFLPAYRTRQSPKNENKQSGRSSRPS